MLTEREVSAAVGGTAYDADGGKLGTVEHFFDGVPVRSSTKKCSTVPSLPPSAS